MSPVKIVDYQPQHQPRKPGYKIGPIRIGQYKRSGIKMTIIIITQTESVNL
jgi:hypothetical protein